MLLATVARQKKEAARLSSQNAVVRSILPIHCKYIQ